MDRWIAFAMISTTIPTIAYPPMIAGIKLIDLKATIGSRIAIIAGHKRAKAAHVKT